MSSAFLKRITKEIKMYEAINFCFDNLIVQPDVDDLHTWYFLIHSLKDSVYADGIYIGIVMLPPGYPFKAPDFKFLSETGRFSVNKKICTTFSAFHNSEFSPAWNIGSMCNGLISFLTDPDDTDDAKGIGKIETTPETKKKIAEESREKIKKHELYEKYFSKFEQVIFKS
jgi:ubiquitin-conjugating enzyme E2 J1